MKRFKTINFIDDLGNNRTVDNKIIRPHLLYRSSNLVSISEEELDRLVNELNIKNDIDLRTLDEGKIESEEFVSKKIKYHVIPLVSDEMNPAVTKENRIAILNELVSLPGGMRQHILDLYKYLINNEQAINGYKKIFDLLLSNDSGEGFLFHCTQGKDRTGIVMLLILSALGVSKERIYQLYLSFNHRTRAKRSMYFLGMNIRFLSWTKAVALNDTLTAKRLYLDTAISEINKNYGSINEYLTEVIGLDEEKINRLKSIYLK